MEETAGATLGRTWFVLTYLFRPDEPEQQAS